MESGRTANVTAKAVMSGPTAISTLESGRTASVMDKEDRNGVTGIITRGATSMAIVKATA